MYGGEKLVNELENAIGLFGTCGNSKWRDRFIAKYMELGIPFFNPQLPPGTWDSTCADIEAEHLANDEIILFPVTGETLGLGSLGEVGFSILGAIRLDDRRDFVIMIDKNVDPVLMSNDSAMAKESNKMRALVIQHLKKLNLRNVYIVDTLDEMLEVSIQLRKAADLRRPFGKYNPQYRKSVLHPNK